MKFENSTWLLNKLDWLQSRCGTGEELLVDAICNRETMMIAWLHRLFLFKIIKSPSAFFWEEEVLQSTGLQTCRHGTFHFAAEMFFISCHEVNKATEKLQNKPIN